ncbi:MAG: TetR family transcriptional regulator [Polyangiaceae bacterium]|jgi:AcrR family transcriptional regulator|nr:TetR family transcriptional regulator [Polyangiaceae bacterium]
MIKKSEAAPSRRARREPTAAAPARRDEVLDAGLTLISELGVAGASLRKLAAKLGMSQPSLYHYFDSKDALVQQIIEHCANNMLEAATHVQFPRGIEDIPRFARDAALALWATDQHPRFVRFMFVVAIESPEHRARIQRVFEERLYPGFGVLADAYGRDPAEREDLRLMVRSIVYAMGLALLEERALFGAPGPSADLLRMGDFIVRASERVLGSRPTLGPIAAPRIPEAE